MNEEEIYSQKIQEEHKKALKLNKDIKFDLNPSSNFMQFMQKNNIFLDKSLLIKDIIETNANNKV